MRHRWILPLAILFAISAALSAQSTDWVIVKQLPPGEKVQIKTIDGKSHVGRVEATGDDTVQLQKGELLRKQDVAQVLLWSGGTRGRHALIGAAVGAAVGVSIGASCHDEPFVSAGRCIAVGAPLFGLLGAGVGAILPARGKWHEVYRLR